MTLANPGTNEPFSTATVNANFEALDTDAGATDASLTANASSITSVGNRVTTIEAGAGRGNLAREVTATPTTLSAITDPLVGDMVRITTPGTGIDAFWAECWASPGSNAADWRPQDTIIAATKANLDTFIAAWIADTDLTFKIGQLAFISGTRTFVRFTSTAGAYNYLDGLVPIKPTGAGAGLTIGADGKVTFSAVAAANMTIDGCFPSDFDVVRMVVDFTLISASIVPTARMRVAGVDSSAATYDYTMTYHSGGAFAISAANSQTSANIAPIAGTQHQITMDFWKPNAAIETNVNFIPNPLPGSGVGVFATNGSFKHRTATAYDGISFPTGGNYTGTIRFYGLNVN